MLEPIRRSEWDRYAAAHFFHRAGFGATPEDVDAAVARDPAEVVNEALNWPAGPYDAPSWMSAEAKQRPDRRAMNRLSEEERRKAQEEIRKREQEWLRELRGWWLQRMRTTRYPLQEKLTLFWHGHFASSAEKVRSAYCLYRQNELFRAHAAGNWKTLLSAVARDPAMLIYLDNAQNRKEHPNENFARELMELFSLGEGRYTERDIKEAARAFTGWTLHPDEFEFIARSRQHDDGQKRFFAQSGNLGGDDIIEIILRQPPAADFIARKIWEFFAFENPPDRLVAALGRNLAQNRFEFRPFLATVFRSREFYSERAMGRQVKSPVQWLVGTCRVLDAPLPPTDACISILRALGQELFQPPSVKGWDGGLAWISTTRLLHRYNIAGLLVKGSERLGARMGSGRLAGLDRLSPVVDPDRALPRERRTELRATEEYVRRRMFGLRVREKDAGALVEYLSSLPPPPEWNGDQVRDILQMTMSTPLYQLC